MKVFKAYLLACALVPAPSLYAQQSSDQTEGLVDIVVTARRTSELLQQTPVAVTALGADSLKQNTVISTSDLQRLAPNLELRSAGGSQGNAFIFIRGIGQNSDDPANEGGVGMYVDDVFMPRASAGVFDLNDVAQIEVLRGPQGTLYGKNSVGGAIKITSKIPDENEDYSAKIAFGNFNDVRLGMSISHPLIEDKLFMRVTGAVHKRKGTSQNLGFGGPVNDIDTASGRLMLRYKASETLDFLWSVDGYRDRSHMANARIADYRTNAGLSPFIEALYGPNALAPYLYTPGSDPDRGAGYDVTQDRVIGRQPFSDQFGTSFRAAWNGDNMTLKSITAYRKLNNSRILDLDGSPFPVLHIGNLTKQNQFSQEFQLSGDLADKTINYFAGLFYFRERIIDDFRASSGVFALASDRRYNQIGTDSYAAYLNVTWNATEQLSATVGGRYTSEKRTLTTTNINPLTNAIKLGPLGGSKTFNNFSPKIEIDYKWTPDIFTYASYSQGFKSGGFNATPGNTDAFAAFEPEKAQAYEVGIKTSFLNKAVILNIAAFHTKYEDLQQSLFRTINNVPVRLVVNSSTVDLNGFEVESKIRPIRDLTFSGSFGMVDSKVKDVKDASLAATLGLPLAISKYHYALSGDYTLPLGDRSSLTAHVDWSWQSRRRFDVIQDTPVAEQAPYGELGARLAYKPSEAVEIAVYGKNLTDRREKVSGSGSLDGFGIYWVYFNDPRTFGIEANFNF